MTKKGVFKAFWAVAMKLHIKSLHDPFRFLVQGHWVTYGNNWYAIDNSNIVWDLATEFHMKKSVTKGWPLLLLRLKGQRLRPSVYINGNFVDIVI